jgi:hypothetical protein
MKTVHQYISSLFFLLAMLCTGTLFGQAGALSFNTPVYNPLTGYTSVAVDWKDNTYATAKGVRIELGLNITSPCIDVAATTVHPDFANDVSFSSSSVIIDKGSSQPFAVQSNHTPLLTLYFRAAPGSTATLLSTFAKLRDINNIFHNITFPDPNALNMTMPVNAQGHVVQTLSLPGFKGRQITELHEVESLQPGVYLLNAATQSQNTSVRFIKL